MYPQPLTNYTVNTIQQCFSNNIFVFTNTSTIAGGTINTYNWNFGDGTSSVTANTTHSYTTAGTYPVQLLITSNNGCKDSLTQNIVVAPQPAGVSFQTNSSTQCFRGNSFSFTASASVNSGTIISYYWNFGDGATATGQTATHNYSAAGTYQVKLVVTTDQGCKDSIIQLVTGYPQPVADFTVNNSGQCLNNNVFNFTNTSTVSTGTIIGYNWSFGNGQNSTLQNPVYTYTVAGTYAVTLIVTTDNGCKDTLVKNVVVYPQPYVCEVVCENDRIAFFKGNITVIR